MSARGSLQDTSGPISTTHSSSSSIEEHPDLPGRRRSHLLVPTNEPMNADYFPVGDTRADIEFRTLVGDEVSRDQSQLSSRCSSSSTVTSHEGTGVSHRQQPLQHRNSRFRSSSDYLNRSGVGRGSDPSETSSASRNLSASGWGLSIEERVRRSTLSYRSMSTVVAKGDAEEEEEDEENEHHLEDQENSYGMGIDESPAGDELLDEHSGNYRTGVEELRKDDEGIDLTTAILFVDRSETLQAQRPLEEAESSATEQSVALERMKYDAPEDPRNYIINMIVNSASGSVTLEFIHNALQWAEHHEDGYGTVLEYLQGYQSIFAVSPIDSRVTLRRPLLTMKGPRSGRWQKRGEQFVANHIGSVSYSYVGEAFDLDALNSIYKRRGYEVEMIYGVLHVWSHRIFDLFLFSNGVVVWWGPNRRDHWLVEDDFLATKHSFVAEAVKDRHTQKDIDELFPIWCSYEMDESTKDSLTRFAAYLCFDHYLIPRVEPTRTHVMLTVSYSLSRSAVVDFFEYVTQWSQKHVLSIPSEIKGLYHYFSTKRQVVHLEGELRLALMAVMALRDTPTFLWEMSWLEDYYELIEKQNSLEGRLSWFSARSDALLQQLNNIKTRRFRLFMLGSDVFLILLLVTDVVFILARLVFKLYFRPEELIE